MAAYTLLNKDQLNEIAARFGLGPITDFKLLEGGSENSNYLISTSAGENVPQRFSSRRILILAPCPQDKVAGSHRPRDQIRHYDLRAEKP